MLLVNAIPTNSTSYAVCLNEREMLLSMHICRNRVMPDNESKCCVDYFTASNVFPVLPRFPSTKLTTLRIRLVLRLRHCTTKTFKVMKSDSTQRMWDSVVEMTKKNSGAEHNIKNMIQGQTRSALTWSLSRPWPRHRHRHTNIILLRLIPSDGFRPPMFLFNFIWYFFYFFFHSIWNKNSFKTEPNWTLE